MKTQDVALESASVQPNFAVLPAADFPEDLGLVCHCSDIVQDAVTDEWVFPARQRFFPTNAQPGKVAVRWLSAASTVPTTALAAVGG